MFITPTSVAVADNNCHIDYVHYQPGTCPLVPHGAGAYACNRTCCRYVLGQSGSGVNGVWTNTTLFALLYEVTVLTCT